jgi:hypothetical protein
MTRPIKTPLIVGGVIAVIFPPFALATVMGVAGYTPEPLSAFEEWVSNLLIWGLLAYIPLYLGALVAALLLKKKAKNVLAYRVSLMPLCSLGICGGLLILRFLA